MGWSSRGIRHVRRDPGGNPPTQLRTLHRSDGRKGVFREPGRETSRNSTGTKQDRSPTPAVGPSCDRFHNFPVDSLGELYPGTRVNPVLSSSVCSHRTSQGAREELTGSWDLSSGRCPTTSGGGRVDGRVGTTGSSGTGGVVPLPGPDT